MLDVHPAHHAATTWRDFFIHIATICIGLLIAIGLEQTVEWLHHNHQRHQLEHDLREEADKNIILMDIDNRRFDQFVPWLTARLKQVAAIRAAQSQPLSDNLPAPPPAPSWIPDAPSWNTAKESGVVILLPPSEAAMFNLVYAQQDLMFPQREAFFGALTAQRSFEQKFSDDPSGTPQPNVSRMTPADLSEYESLLIATLNATLRFQTGTTIAYKITCAVRDGATTDEQLFRMIGGRPGSVPLSDNNTSR